MIVGIISFSITRLKQEIKPYGRGLLTNPRWNHKFLDYEIETPDFTDAAGEESIWLES